MSRINRYFPVSHDINRDPEVWELTETFGGWLLYAWLEILAVTDPNDGEWLGDPAWIAERLSKLSRGLRHEKDQIRRRWKGTLAAERCQAALYWMCLKNWLQPIIVGQDGENVIESWPNRARLLAEWYANRPRIVTEWSLNGTRIIGFKVRNYAKYHKTRGTKQLPSEPNLTIPNHNTKEEEENTHTPSKEAYSKVFEEFWGFYPRKDEKQGAFTKWKATVRRGASEDDLIVAAKNYQLSTNGTENHYLKLARTFLGPEEPWKEYLAGPKEDRNGGNQRSSNAEPKGFGGIRDFLRSEGKR